MQIILYDAFFDHWDTFVFFLDYHFENSLQRSVWALIQIPIFNHFQVGLVESIYQRIKDPHNDPAQYDINPTQYGNQCKCLFAIYRKTSEKCDYSCKIKQQAVEIEIRLEFGQVFNLLTWMLKGLSWENLLARDRPMWVGAVIQMVIVNIKGLLVELLCMVFNFVHQIIFNVYISLFLW